MNRRSEEIEWVGKRHLLHFFDYSTGDKDYVIWGLTAIILIRVASLVYQRPPAFIERIPNFKHPRMVGQHIFLLSRVTLDAICYHYNKNKKEKTIS